MIYLTINVGVGVSVDSHEPDTNYLYANDPEGIRDLDHFLALVGGWSNFFDELTTNTSKSILILSTKDLIRLVCVFVKNVFPIGSQNDLVKFSVCLIDAYFVSTLYLTNKVKIGPLDINQIALEISEAPKVAVTPQMLEKLEIVFLLSDYHATGVARPELIEYAKSLAYDSFVLHMTVCVDSILEGNFEQVFIDIEDFNDDLLKVMKDSAVPLFDSDPYDAVECTRHILSNYSKEYLIELSLRCLSKRAPKLSNGVSNREMVSRIISERYDQISKEDWISFIESDLGLYYVLFFTKKPYYRRFPKNALEFTKVQTTLAVVPVNEPAAEI